MRLHPGFGVRRHVSSVPRHQFANVVTAQSSSHQVYVSRSLDPYVNLSIEHFLLQKSPSHSTILFLYTNHPCIVIGRNQNPWYEVNLRLLNTACRETSGNPDSTRIENVSLVRRRSGGGTVFHDEGNVNYSVICPSAEFHRDKHAQMVVDALRDLDVCRAKVNHRHDIILDQEQSPVKVSGSAYKLVRQRALHHGTCLLSSPYLNLIPHFLHSPAKPYIKARGVESVSSPISNVGLSNQAFEDAVVRQFSKMYGAGSDADGVCEEDELAVGSDWVRGVVGDSQLQEVDIRKGYDELKSAEWIFGQTPFFSLSSKSLNVNDDAKPSLESANRLLWPILMEIRSGKISTMRTLGIDQLDSDANINEQINQALLDKTIHEIKDFKEVFRGQDVLQTRGAVQLAQFLNDAFGKGLD
ncbi:MAG: Biotin/lipoate A/B protein ligase [Piccolia ochrophora]|nr:MAG: Biotin/lipoate A/B protein ligase [Piccolia ochrophora]